VRCVYDGVGSVVVIGVVVVFWVKSCGGDW
jgi:hypothetical protein